MRQHDPSDLYLLGAISRLNDLKPGHMAAEYRDIANQVIFVLKQFAASDFNIRYLPNATSAAGLVAALLNQFLTADWQLDETYVENLLRQGAISHFESALSIDIKALPLFIIEDKRGYSSRAFLTDASVVLSEQDRAALASLTLEDLAEAGRCLLLDRHTAAGFHTMRALEAVARSYYRLIFNAEPLNKNNGLPLGLRTVADHLRKQKTKLESSNIGTGALGDIIPTVDRLASIYRNNIMHPEMTLDEDLAIEVFDNAKTAIAAMLRDVRTSGPHFQILWSDVKASWKF